MDPVPEAPRELQDFCTRQNWRFCFIGELAVQRWGEPRNTQDADLTLLTGFSHEAELFDALLSHFKGRRADTKAFALQYRVLLLHATNGIPLALGTMLFEENSFARSSWWSLPGDIHLRTCSAEDLIVYKTFAERERDWLDIEGVLLVQQAQLDLH